MNLDKTVELLDKNMDKVVSNESAIIDTIGDIIAYLERVDKRFAHLEGHIGQLTKRPAVIVKPNSKMFLVTAVVASGYFGYKLADRRFREKLQKASEEAIEKAKQAYVDSVQKISEPKQGTYFVDNTASSDEPPVKN